MFRTIKSAITAAVIAFAITPATSQALTLQDGLTPAGGTTWNSLAAVSVDPVASLAYIAQLAPYLDQQAYILPNPFDGGPAGSAFNTIMLTEIAGNANSNKLDLCSVDPIACTEIFSGSDTPGETASVDLSAGTNFFFKLTGPGGTFFSNPALNPNNSDHFLAFKVVKSGIVTITPTTLGGGSIDIELLAGDLLIGIEDMPLFNIGSCQLDRGQCNALVAQSGDRDYNDMLFHARVSEIPEPATLSLLGLGALGLRPFMKRKRS